ncbi:hypothetical protein A9Z58_08710 [Haemophilus influenzae]|uniref:Card1-like endonuclease domain-containing protein n=1 Tax=Haemophilus influenzae TaxID=727 RepID=UPI0005AF1D37|nr:DUF1887 family CARF protein [Haemophilus influenzae]KIP50276.1 hypothetical protein SU59_00335 [Haemophilus influenzae]KMZ29994.1 hypothetical protein ABN30_08960 [Haemophilus influenzae]MCK8911971.1 DUF1887 family CARF protein [Haemophilus influenzae]MCK9096596.1 DUF1887 family CARF protein [Haemophilus influenzae]OBX54612.1 hypothetical protein A9Z58_08710 [Haemophilus influenzae]
MQPKYDVHFCLISDQAAPSLLPILDPDFKPKEAVFLVSDKMKSNAEALANVFKEKNVKVTLVRIENIYDFHEMENCFIEQIDQFDGQNIALNVTGGTKLMAIVAQNTFAMGGKPIFYVDSDNNQILFISRDEKGQSIPNKILNCQIDLKTYLSAYGMVYKSVKQPLASERLIANLEPFIKQYDKYKDDIPLLNSYAKESQKSGFKVDFKHHKLKSLVTLLEELHHKDLLDFDHNHIDFRDTVHKDLLNGIWLEEITYKAIENIKSIQDKALSLEVGNSSYDQSKHQYALKNQGNQNELDIAFIAKNRLHIIECKTQLMNKEGGIKSEEILYKLEALKNYGGLMTKKCLVSYFEVPESVKNRAKELHIEIIQGKDLQRLREKIANWIGKA